MKVKTLVCFGDSITATEKDKYGYDRLTPRLAKGLQDWKVINRGIDGNTTVDAIQRIEKDVLSLNPDLVTVFFGANDAAFHKMVALSDYKANLIRMTNLVGPKKTILISPAPVNENLQKSRTNEMLAAYAKIVEEVAMLTGAHYLNYYKEMLQQHDYQEMLTEDGLHFNHKGYIFLSSIILRKIKKCEN